MSAGLFALAFILLGVAIYLLVLNSPGDDE